ncbi:serine hydrolase domain-containing protein [Aquimarina megaterium]|uniref:serine hydrolase domain-containing protein n=1 Tax=Aquimarina megaterium TaxID=1443666 RepID=UPI0004B7C122|nr:serine hydrolase domain-containing protein [Aquimarina megaterium]
MNKIALLLLSILTLFSCQKNTSEKVLKNEKQEIETYLKEQIKTHEIPGLALAVIKNGKVIFEGYFGKADLENNLYVDKQTIFPLYSITKLIVSTAVYQLIEQGKLSLEDTISQYIDNLPNEWKDIKIIHLLTHSSGLPDFTFEDRELTDKELKSKLFKEKIHFEKGNQYEYNQTNYWFIAQIIEKITKQTVAEFVLKNQFSENKGEVLISSNFKDSIPNRANRYYFVKELKQYRNSNANFQKRSHAANGLNSTLREFIQWNKRLDENLLLKNETKFNMWKPFDYANGTDKFLYGWKIYTSNSTISYGLTGGLQTGYRKFVANDLTVIILTNGSKYFPVHNSIINRIAGIVDATLFDKKLVVEQILISSFLDKDLDKAVKKYYKLKEENPNISFEENLNTLGYIFLNNNMVKKAIKIFEINVNDNPESANCYDSLAEAYLVNNQFELSKNIYKKSLKLNPENNNAKAMIEAIEKRIKG